MQMRKNPEMIEGMSVVPCGKLFSVSAVRFSWVGFPGGRYGDDRWFACWPPLCSTCWVPLSGLLMPRGGTPPLVSGIVFLGAVPTFHPRPVFVIGEAKPTKPIRLGRLGLHMGGSHLLLSHKTGNRGAKQFCRGHISGRNSEVFRFFVG